MALGVGVALIQFIWFFGVDGPHVQSTITRTYFDKAERARLGWYLWIPVPLLLLGPAMVWAGLASLFFLFAVCWQQFHIVKQHFGFMMLYKAKNKDRDRTDFLLDRWLLLSSLLIPLGMFVLRTRPIDDADRSAAGMAAGGGDSDCTPFWPRAGCYGKCRSCAPGADELA